MTLMEEEFETESITVTADSILGMSTGNPFEEPHVYELTGPPQTFFEMPLDWYVNANGELTPEAAAGAVRLIQRVHYKSFALIGPDAMDVQSRAMKVVDAVRAELKRLGDIGYIWWRLLPKHILEEVPTHDEAGKPTPPRAARHKVRLRLGTLPTLSTRFWLDLSKEVSNISSEPLVPRE